ncbi:MAG: Ni/Fe-hydrogenase, b-type cytochrome subunit [Syntrophaceae bacterium]
MEKIIAHKEWSVAMLINHWAMAISIFVLIATGFYIADPFTVAKGETIYKFLMGDMRYIHILFGIFLTFLFLWRIYLAFFSRFHADWKDFFAFANLKATLKQIRFYLLIDKEAPEHKGLYGPLQSLAYAGLLFMVLVIVVTGLILMGAGYNAGLTALLYKILKPVENVMGGLAVVRYIHHIFTWFFILFIVVHIYMAFWYDAILQEGTVSSMISGKVFKKVKE